MVRSNSYYAEMKRRGWGDPKTTFKVEVDGKEVDLEDAFETFEQIFEDADQAFEKMGEVFRYVDENIWDKLDDLKRKIAAERSDEFEYVPESDYGDSTIKKKTMDRNNLIRQSQNHTIKMMIILLVGVLLFMFSVFFFISMTPSPKNDTTPSPKIEEKLDSL